MEQESRRRGWIGSDVSPELIPRLKRFLASLDQDPPDLGELRAAMIDLLEYLATSEGRTDANCTATDRAIGAQNEWKFDWQVPEAYSEILWDMAGQLHDTVSSPEIAANFESTPEQLLARAKALPEQ